MENSVELPKKVWLTSTAELKLIGFTGNVLRKRACGKVIIGFHVNRKEVKL